MPEKKSDRLLNLKLLEKILMDIEKLLGSYGLKRTEIKFVIREMYDAVNAVDTFVSSQGLKKFMGELEPHPNYAG